MLSRLPASPASVAWMSPAPTSFCIQRVRATPGSPAHGAWEQSADRAGAQSHQAERRPHAYGTTWPACRSLPTLPLVQPVSWANTESHTFDIADLGSH